MTGVDRGSRIEVVRGLGAAAAVAALVAALLLALAPRAEAARSLLVAGDTTVAAPAGGWPSVAAIVRSGVPDARAGLICTGTVVGAYAVLTEASCVSASGIPVDAASLHVVTGRQVLSSGEGQRVPVARIHLDPSSEAAILHLAVGVTVPAARLATPGEDAALSVVGAPAVIAGWGSPIAPADALQQASVLLGTVTGALRCPGDRGAPVVRTDAAGATVQLGFVVTSPTACESGVLRFRSAASIAAWATPVIASTMPVIPPPVQPAGRPQPVPVNLRPSVRRTWTATVRRGKSIRLRYQVDDDSLRTRETITIYNPRGRLIKRVRKPLQTLSPDAIYGITFRVPKKAMLGRWRYCVEVRDAEGLRDRECRYFRVRR